MIDALAAGLIQIISDPAGHTGKESTGAACTVITAIAVIGGIMSRNKSFLDRRHEVPDYEIEAWVTGVKCPNGKVHWNVVVVGEDDPVVAAGMLERAAEVLRAKSGNKEDL